MERNGSENKVSEEWGPYYYIGISVNGNGISCTYV